MQQSPAASGRQPSGSTQRPSRLTTAQCWRTGSAPRRTAASAITGRRCGTWARRWSLIPDRLPSISRGAGKWGRSCTLPCLYPSSLIRVLRVQLALAEAGYQTHSIAEQCSACSCNCPSRCWLAGWQLSSKHRAQGTLFCRLRRDLCDFAGAEADFRAVLDTKPSHTKAEQELDRASRGLQALEAARIARYTCSRWSRGSLHR
jgi:hypothetical protein